MVPLAKVFEFSLRARGKKPAIAVPVAITNAVFLLRVATGNMDVTSRGEFMIQTLATARKKNDMSIQSAPIPPQLLTAIISNARTLYATPQQVHAQKTIP